MKIDLGKYEIHLIKKPIKKYRTSEVVNIALTTEMFRRKVNGAVRSCCDAHPEIPRDLIGSISKRVVGEVLGTNGIPEYMMEE